MTRRRHKKMGEPEPVPRIALRQREAAAALGVGEEYFRRHIAAELPVIERGRFRLYPVAGLQAWAEKNAEVPR